MRRHWDAPIKTREYEVEFDVCSECYGTLRCLETRKRFGYVYRRRACDCCNARTTTVEIAVDKKQLKQLRETGQLDYSAQR